MTVPVWLMMVFLQAVMSGMVTSLIVEKGWVGVLLSSFMLNEIWWLNMGQRIERHKQWWAGHVYSLVISVGTLLGAWYWR